MHIKIIALDSRCGKRFKLSDSNALNGHLFVRFKSPSRVHTADGWTLAKPGSFIFFRAGDLTEYESTGCDFVHDYFRFELDGELPVPVSTLFPYQLSNKLSKLLELMQLEYSPGGDGDARVLDLLGECFLLSASEYVACGKSLAGSVTRYNELSELRAEMLAAPSYPWSVRMLAERVSMSPTYFQSTYRSFFGTSCMKDVIAARIERAEYLLSTTDKKEREIAELCGYNNVEHFIRQFKKLRGTTPAKYRRSRAVNR